MPDTLQQSHGNEAAATPEGPADPAAAPAKRAKHKDHRKATEDLTKIILGALLHEVLAPVAFKELVGQGGAVADAAAGLKLETSQKKQRRRRTGLSVYNIFTSLMVHHVGAKLAAAGACWRGMGQQQQEQLAAVVERLTAIKPIIDRLAAKAAGGGGGKVQIAAVLEEYEEQHDLEPFDWKHMLTYADLPDSPGRDEDANGQQQQKQKAAAGKKQPAAAAAAPVGRDSKKKSKKKQLVPAGAADEQQQEAPAAKKHKKHHKQAAGS